MLSAENLAALQESLKPRSSMLIGDDLVGIKDEFLLIGFPNPVRMAHLECLAQVLLGVGDNAKLTKYVSNLEMAVIKKSPILLWAKVKAEFNGGQWESVVELIRENNFVQKHHKDLRTIWDEAHYKLYERQHGKYPQEVQRFRIRKRHTYPPTVWNGNHFKYLFTINDRVVLEEFYKNNPHPSRKDKEELSDKTELTMAQVSTWFKNRRNRHKESSGVNGNFSGSGDELDIDTDTEDTETLKKSRKRRKL